MYHFDTECHAGLPVSGMQPDAGICSTAFISSYFYLQGAPQLLVPYLAEARHICPTTHNPADFVLETLLGDVEIAAHLSELSQNGKLCRKLDRMASRGGR